MKIGLDVTQAVKRRGRGIARYVRGLVGALPDACADLELVLFVRGTRWWRRERIDGLAPGCERRWAPGPVFPVEGRMRDLDAFHGLGTHLPARAGVPTSFTLHDLRDFAGLSEPLARDRAPRAGQRKWRTVRRATAILCPSAYGKRRLLELCPWIAAESVAAVAHGIDHDRFKPADERERRALRRALALERRFVLQVGSFFPHKNIELALAAFARSRARREGFEAVFCGGGASAAYERALGELASELGVADAIRWIPHVPEAELPALYSEAELLLFPSRYEGFGFPILEAMACGTAGVTSDSTCLPEVAAGIWPSVGADEPEAMAAEMDRLIFDSEAAERTVARGRAHAAEFTWRACAERTGEFLRENARRGAVAPVR